MLKRQVKLFNEYMQESVEAGAHIGLVFFIAIIAFGVWVFQTKSLWN